MTQEHASRRRRRLTATVTDLKVAVQRALLVGVVLPGMSQEAEERSLDELALLTDTAGSDPVDSEIVRRDVIDPATYIGKGKADELAVMAKAMDIDVVVFDHALSPAQQRNLMRIFECDVVDREAVILDIFAQHATSKVGAIQVELALLRYHLPRLRGRGKSFSQQGAGVGIANRGPGETKLETDRRRILARITKLERQLAASASHRETQRKQRRRNQVPQVSIVGYTNAGKSTLLNSLTKAEVLVEDRLFATLDPTVRKLALPGRRLVLLADTVGFVRRLPHGLVESFRSTLAEATEADLLLHLVDGTDPDVAGQIAAVREVLSEIGAADIAELLVINKIDALSESQQERIRNLYPDALLISAQEGTGFDTLLETIAERLATRLVVVSLAIPYSRGDVVAAAHRLGEVIEEKHDEAGTILDVRVPAAEVGRFAAFAR
ncbi:MAG: GTPase HflX [Actinobacteria bacterium]|nr:GTPase HflX [Actinomycetota bacterium]MCI0678748.1 GTPase HflX [Actinomycetota bacterium]